MASDRFKILIVDDSLLNLEALRGILTSVDAVTGDAGEEIYTVFTANSGLEALEKVETEKPDLILLDIIMPGMDGFEVLARLKASAVTSPIPVIIITGLDREQDEERGFSLGAVEYITKPFKKSIVSARIKTHQKIVEQMRIIERMSLIDALTDMPNRRNFDNRISMEWKRSIREKTPISVLMIDIDRFKKFNDTYGHQNGDIALKSVACSIEAALNRPADFAARWGGEEFAVILPNTGLASAAMIAERIRSNVGNGEIPGIGDNPPLHVTVSIGASSIIPSVDSLVTDIIGQADKALYAAKEAGRNRVSA